MSQIVYVTGTNTGEGKTLLTGLLLHYWRSRGIDAMAIKPFASGGGGDTRILVRLQDKILPESQVTPYRFREALTPLAAARMHRRQVPMAAVVDHIQRRSTACRILLIEGAGGLLSPLGEGYSLADLIRTTGGQVLVAAKNRLGVLNPLRLTYHYLTSSFGARCDSSRICIVLMAPRRPSLVSRSNPVLLKELLSPTGVEILPHLGPKAVGVEKIKKSSIKCKKTLARLSQFDNLQVLLREKRGSGAQKKLRKTR